MSALPEDLSWQTSSYSGNQGGQCVEVARTLRAVYIRDTQNRGKDVIEVAPAAWDSFLHTLRGR